MDLGVRSNLRRRSTRSVTLDETRQQRQFHCSWCRTGERACGESVGGDGTMREKVDEMETRDSVHWSTLPLSAHRGAAHIVVCVRISPSSARLLKVSSANSYLSRPKAAATPRICSAKSSSSGL